MRRLAILLAVLAVGMAGAQEKKSPAPQKAPAKEAPVVPPREGKSETIHLFDGKTSTGGRDTRTCGRSRTARLSPATKSP